MPFIDQNIKKYVSPGDTICDIFSGSASVASQLKDQYSIIANDFELYSSIISSSLLNTPDKETLNEARKLFLNGFDINMKLSLKKYESVVVEEGRLLELEDPKMIIDFYSTLPTVWNTIDESINPENLRKRNNYDLFLYYYAGTYFGVKQSIAIDAAIKTIHEMGGQDTKDVILSCLFYAIKESVFSKDGHMAQPLNIEKNSSRHSKQRSKTIIDLLDKKLNEFISHSPDTMQEVRHKVYNLEMSELLNNGEFIKQKPKLIYADPPYTDMQYSRYYHLLNVAAKYDYPDLTISNNQFTKGLYTEGRNQSDLSKKSSAKLRLEELFKYCQSNDIVLALSYAYPKDYNSQKTDRYTVSIEELVDMAKSVFGNKKVQIEQEDYKHANHRNSSAKEVLEYLILCGQEIEGSKYDIVKLKQDIKSLTPTSRNPVYDTHLYWSQKSFNVIDSLIEHLSQPGEVVFDPFMGSGVTVLEAVHENQGRIGVGCDINEMPSFIVNNILDYIPNSDLKLIFEELNSFLSDLQHYYETNCPTCSKKAVISKVVFDKPKRTENNFNIKAISYICNTCGKGVREGAANDYKKFATLKCNKFVANSRLIQNTKIAVGESDTISDIFTPRNLSVLNEIVGYISTSKHANILNYLLMSVLHLAKITDTHSNSQWPLWIPRTNCVEKNIITSLHRRMDNLIKAQPFASRYYAKGKIVNEFSKLSANDALILTKGSQFITNDEVPNDSVSLIITDPPYMDQVLYSEYMQLYQPFIGLDFNVEDEIVVSSAAERKRSKEEYFRLLDEVFKMCSLKLKENHIMCLFFHDSNLDVWSRLMRILESNGFRFISQEHIKKSKTVKNILSPKKSLSGDAVLFFENTRTPLPSPQTSADPEDIERSVFLEAKKLLEKHGDLSTPELYDLGVMEMLIENGWLDRLSQKYKSLVDIFEDHFIWKIDSGKWHLQARSD